MLSQKLFSARALFFCLWGLAFTFPAVLAGSEERERGKAEWLSTWEVPNHLLHGEFVLSSSLFLLSVLVLPSPQQGDHRFEWSRQPDGPGKWSELKITLPYWDRLCHTTLHCPTCQRDWGCPHRQCTPRCACLAVTRHCATPVPGSALSPSSLCRITGTVQQMRDFHHRSVLDNMHNTVKCFLDLRFAGCRKSEIMCQGSIYSLYLVWVRSRHHCWSGTITAAKIKLISTYRALCCKLRSWSGLELNTPVRNTCWYNLILISPKQITAIIKVTESTEILELWKCML